ASRRLRAISPTVDGSKPSTWAIAWTSSLNVAMPFDINANGAYTSNTIGVKLRWRWVAAPDRRRGEVEDRRGVLGRTALRNFAPAQLRRGKPSESQMAHAATIGSSQVLLCEVSPSGVPGEFQAVINGELVVQSSRVPLLDAARALLARSADSNGWLIMRHAG